MVRNRIGTPTYDSFINTEVIDESINLTLQSIDAEHSWPWTERRDEVTTTASTLTAPSDWRATRSILCGLRELTFVTPYDLDRMGGGTGTPSCFALVNRTIRFDPEPTVGTELIHYYFVRTPLLANDDDVPEIPEQYTGAVVAKAAQLIANREDDRAAAESHMLEYMEQIRLMKRDVRQSTRPVGRRIRPGAWT